MRIDHNGNVGIGATNPGAKLGIVANSGGSSLILTDNVNSTLTVKHESPSNLLTYQGYGGTTQRWTSLANDSATPVEHMRITSLGDVGIGTNNPKAKLHIEGNQVIIRGSAPTLAFIDTTSSTYPGDNSHKNAILHNNGGLFYLLPGTTDDVISWPQSGLPNNRWPLYISLETNDAVFGGNVNAISFTTASSIRFKKDIVPLENSLDIVQKLQGVSYAYIWDKSSDYDIGLIAEDVENVLPVVVKHDENNLPDSIEYSKLTVVLIEAMKEQQKIINSLQSRLEILEAKTI
jgi:hypothetical protein